MGGLKKLGRVLFFVAIFGLIWWTSSAKQQVNQVKDEISYQYFFANILMRNTVIELLEWNFSQPLTDSPEDKYYLHNLSAEVDYTASLIFSGNVVHHDWKIRLYDIQNYIQRYILDSSLTEEDAADLHQALRATRFIATDFIDNANKHKKYLYDAMHDEKHEMVEQVKSRLDVQY
ncbi:hypothetical protein MKZ17_09800 [Solibacillus sp. FSL R7-0682]|uniref:hypothetical protein n=1 Tax=Solibacillus sp. FSL R7-0682 TaxID=2921690 RepID=UPI0030F731DA